MRFSETINPSVGELVLLRVSQEVDREPGITGRLPADLDTVRYAIHDRRLLRERPTEPVSTHARVHANGIYVTRIADRIQTEMAIGGAGLPRYGFALANAGSMQVTQAGNDVVAQGRAGFALRGRPGTQLISSQGNVRTLVWIETDVLVRALAEVLHEPPARPLEFAATVNWATGLAVSLRRQLAYFASELRRADGLATNPLALASLSDLILQTLLQALPHNHSDRLSFRPGDATPGILTRAEAYMRGHAHEPIRMADVAASAGCGVRTLSAVYSRFRETTPLAALHAIRLAQAREALQRDGCETVAQVAARHGFSNPGRFAKVYRRQYGERPSETAAPRD